MSDNFIDEIKEEIRQDQIQSIWRNYGSMIIGTIVAIVVATIAYLFWHNYQEKKLTEQTLRFESQLEIMNDATKSTENGSGASKTSFQEATSDSSKGYQLLGQYLDAGQKTSLDAARELLELSKNTSFKPFYRDLAELQAIMRKFDDTNGNELLQDLSSFMNTSDGKPSVLLALAFELQGYAHMKLGNAAKAAEAFRQVIENKQATPSMGVRAKAMLELL